MVSYLPLSHIAGQLNDIFLPMFVSAVTAHTYTVYFAQPDAMQGTLFATMRAARPTVFMGVPRVWEKMRDHLESNGFTSNGGHKGQAGGGVNGTPPAQSAREVLGLTEARWTMTGAAPVSAELLEYFFSPAVDIPVYNTYGLSEICGPCTIEVPGLCKIGSIGPTISGCEVKVVKVMSGGGTGDDCGVGEDGEICFRGRNVMMGYMKNLAKTTEAMDEQGWLHSGDIGRMDGAGLLYITGRMKEILVTAGGENIAPVRIEDELKDLMPAVANAMVVGDAKKYLTVLLTLRAVPGGAAGGQKSATLDGAAKGVDQAVTTVAEAIASIEGGGGGAMEVGGTKGVGGDTDGTRGWGAYLQSGLQRYNNERASSRATRLQKFRILPADFTLEGGELTPTLKLKRPVVVAKYGHLIEQMYAEAKARL
jgi:long-chain-fatty-acid--CoA ligase ACSBG